MRRGIFGVCNAALVLMISVLFGALRVEAEEPLIVGFDLPCEQLTAPLAPHPGWERSPGAAYRALLFRPLLSSPQQPRLSAVVRTVRMRREGSDGARKQTVFVLSGPSTEILASDGSRLGVRDIAWSIQSCLAAHSLRADVRAVESPTAAVEIRGVESLDQLRVCPISREMLGGGGAAASNRLAIAQVPGFFSGSGPFKITEIRRSEVVLMARRELSEREFYLRVACNTGGREGSEDSVGFDAVLSGKMSAAFLADISPTLLERVTNQPDLGVSVERCGDGSFVARRSNLSPKSGVEAISCLERWDPSAIIPQ